MLRTDVTHEKAVSAVLDERLELHQAGLPEVAGHGLLAVMKAIREATAQLSLVEDRLHVIGERLVRPPRFVLVDDHWINPSNVVRIESVGDYDVAPATIYFADGKQITFLKKTADELMAELSW